MSRKPRTLPASSPSPPLQVPFEQHAFYQKITLQLQMLRSVNQKNKVNRSKRGRPVYTDPKYEEEVNRMVKAAREQAESVGWQVAEEDRYVIVYHLAFPASNGVRRDLHNPLKPICDALVEAGILCDDNLTVQEDLAKLHATTKTPGSCQMAVTIYRFPNVSKVFPFPVDLTTVFDHLAQNYNQQQKDKPQP